ncbi:MAG: tetratricopeptide repeat protein [Pseudomonadota bacterium]
MGVIPEGVYLESLVQDIGTGGTARKQVIKNFYFAAEKSPGIIRIQLLDMHDKPLPITEDVPLEQFKKRFEYQPNYKQDKKNPTEIKVDKAIAQAEAHFRKKEFYSAEFEYGKALKLDEENVRANFGVAKVYLATGETEKARETFQKLAQVEAIFEEQNKHIFNELGIELRRLGLFGQAITFYKRALSVAKDDENLYFNIGRAFHEKNEPEKARKCLQAALKLNPNMPEAVRLLESLNKADVPGDPKT